MVAKAERSWRHRISEVGTDLIRRFRCRYVGSKRSDAIVRAAAVRERVKAIELPQRSPAERSVNEQARIRTYCKDGVGEGNRHSRKWLQADA